MIHSLCLAGRVPTGATTQESERGTEKRATCGSALRAAILSVHSVWLSCNSRAGRAEGKLSEETAEGGLLDEMGGGFYWKWHRPAKYHIYEIIRYYDMTAMARIAGCRMRI
jgi:hypothetical protein